MPYLEYIQEMYQDFNELLEERNSLLSDLEKVLKVVQTLRNVDI